MSCAMTALRLIPLPVHAAIEMLVGLAIGIAPFALGLSTPAMIVGVVAGALIVGMAVGLDDHPMVSAHLAADQGIAFGLAAAAAVMAFSDDAIAAVLFAGTAVGHLFLILATRYTAR